jgi:ribosomal-protein-alanine N-acetyltransferase
MMDSGLPRPVTVVEVTVLESALLAELHRAVFTAPWDRAWSAESMAQILAMPGAKGWLLERESMPLGFVLARFTLDEGEILLTGIHPTARGQGYGRRLMEAAIAASREAGIARLFLEYAAPNAAAAALYQSLGFAQIGRRRGYYADAAGHQHDAITLALELMAAKSIDPAHKKTGER